MILPSSLPGRATVFINIYSLTDSRLTEVAILGHMGVKRQKALMRQLCEGEGWDCERMLDEMDAVEDLERMFGQYKSRCNRWWSGRRSQSWECRKLCCRRQSGDW